MYVQKGLNYMKNTFKRLKDPNETSRIPIFMDEISFEFSFQINWIFKNALFPYTLKLIISNYSQDKNYLPIIDVQLAIDILNVWMVYNVKEVWDEPLYDLIVFARCNMKIIFFTIFYLRIKSFVALFSNFGCHTIR